MFSVFSGGVSDVLTMLGGPDGPGLRASFGTKSAANSGAVRVSVRALVVSALNCDCSAQRERPRDPPGGRPISARQTRGQHRRPANQRRATRGQHRRPANQRPANPRTAQAAGQSAPGNPWTAQATGQSTRRAAPRGLQPWPRRLTDSARQAAGQSAAGKPARTTNMAARTTTISTAHAY